MWFENQANVGKYTSWDRYKYNTIRRLGLCEYECIHTILQSTYCDSHESCLHMLGDFPCMGLNTVVAMEQVIVSVVLFMVSHKF